MDNNKKIKENLESSAVQAHLSMLQDIINRMSGNSANCKNWAVALVAAMVAILADKEVQISNTWICLLPIIPFYLLDCYYLGLERLCIEAQESFLKKLDEDNDCYVEDLYKVEELKSGCKQMGKTLEAMWSVSTTPFYAIVAIGVWCFRDIICI